MARPKLSEEELKLKQEEREKQVAEYKKQLNNIINDMDDKTILKLFDTLNGYNGISKKDSINLLFNKFIAGDFKFKVKCIYE